MNENPIKNNSNITVFVTLLSFLMLGLLSLYFFLFNFVSLILDLINFPPEISFNKGSFYLLGIGVILFVFIVGGFNTYYKKKVMTAEANKKITNILIFLLFLTFILPSITYFLVEPHLLKNNYEICGKKSKQWLHVKTIVFSKSGMCN